MLGKRAPRDGKPAAAKKRKWQEELASDSEEEAKITKADFEEWSAKMKDEEKRERLEKERQEKEERDRERKRIEAEEAKRKQEEEEESRAQKEASEARKLAEDRENAMRKQEALAPPGALPPDVGGIVPPGMNPTKMHLYKTTYCKRWEQGNCNFGAACHFAHGDRDLRGNRPLKPLGASVAGASAASVLPPPPPPVGMHVPAGAPGVPMHLGAMRPPGPGQAPPGMRPEQAVVALNQMLGMMGQGDWSGEWQPSPNSQAGPQAQWRPPPGAVPTGSSGPHPGGAPFAGDEEAPWQQLGADGSSWRPPGAPGVEAPWQQPSGEAPWQQPGPGGEAAWQQPGAEAAWHQPGGSAGWQLGAQGLEQ